MRGGEPQVREVRRDLVQMPELAPPGAHERHAEGEAGDERGDTVQRTSHPECARMRAMHKRHRSHVGFPPRFARGAWAKGASPGAAALEPAPGPQCLMSALLPSRRLGFI